MSPRTSLPVLLACCLATGCAADSTGGDSNAPTDGGEAGLSSAGAGGGGGGGRDGDSCATVGSEGAEFVGIDSAGFDVPRGALIDDVELCVSKVAREDLPALPEGLTWNADAFSFTPHGTPFDRPVRVRLPFDGGNAAMLALDGLEDETWQRRSGSYNSDTNMSTAEVTRFGIFVVAQGQDDIPE